MSVDSAAPPPPPDAAVDAPDPPPLPPFDLLDPKECLKKENVWYVVAEAGASGYPIVDESPNPGLSTVIRFSMTKAPTLDQTVQFFAEPSGFQYGGLRMFTFSLQNLKQAIVTGVVYDEAVSTDDLTTPKPSLSVFGSCGPSDAPTGRFVFHLLERKPDARASRFIVAYERRCGPFKPALRGCVHYDETNP